VRPSRQTRLLAAGAAGAGVTTAVLAVRALVHGPQPTVEQTLLALSLCVLVAATWMWPLVLYRDGESEAFNLAEGAFVIMALLLPLPVAIVVFAVAAGTSEIARHHTGLKLAFNWGQMVIAAGAGLAVTQLMTTAGSRITAPDLGAALAGVMVFAAVNTLAMALLGVTLGAGWRTAAGGMSIRLRLTAGCVGVALVAVLAISSYPWSVPVALLPFLIFRQVLAGHFQARHDRTRLNGLLDTALQANAAMGEGDPLGDILQSARSLLRSPAAEVRAAPPAPGQLGAAMQVDGERRWLVVSGRPRTEPFDAADGSLLEALAAVGAVALTNARLYREGRFQQERLAAITASVADGVCAFGPHGTLTFMNPAAAGMLGWQPIPAPGSARATDLDPAPLVPPFLSAPVLEVMRTRETLRRDDAEFPRPDGTVVPVALTASTIMDGDEVAGAVVVFRDVTRWREAEVAIREARDQAIESSRLKSQFLANMSHEIRTPMNGVLGLCRMLLESGVTETQRKYLLALQDCGNNLMVIINDVLDYSKIEAGKLALEEVDFDLRAVLIGVTNTLAVQAYDKGLLMCVDVNPTLPPTVRGDPVRLRQILINLVGNAIKFSEAGAVSVAAEPIGGGRVRIAVTDTGIGIDPALRGKVLSAFGQADSSTTRRYGGTGLGLAICTHLVGMMGGILDFVSQPGNGSCFWIELPLGEPPHGEAAFGAGGLKSRGGEPDPLADPPAAGPEAAAGATFDQAPENWRLEPLMAPVDRAPR
jgi:PAS domain S-box-containing protein